MVVIGLAPNHPAASSTRVHRGGVYLFVYELLFAVLAVLYVQTDWDMDALLNAASQRLDMVPSARRLFNADG